MPPPQPVAAQQGAPLPPPPPSHRAPSRAPSRPPSPRLPLTPRPPPSQATRARRRWTSARPRPPPPRGRHRACLASTTPSSRRRASARTPRDGRRAGGAGGDGAGGGEAARAPVVRTVVDAEEDADEGEEGEPMPRKIRCAACWGWWWRGDPRDHHAPALHPLERKSNGAMQQVLHHRDHAPRRRLAPPLLLRPAAHALLRVRRPRARPLGGRQERSPPPGRARGRAGVSGVPGRRHRRPPHDRDVARRPLKVDEMVGVVAVPGKTVVSDVDAADFETKYEKQ